VGDSRITPRVLYRTVLLAFALLVVVLVFPVLAGLLLLLLLIAIAAVPMCRATDVLQERLRIPRAVGAPLMLVAGIAVVAGVVALLVPVFTTEGRHLVNSLPSLVEQVRVSLGRSAGAPPAGGQGLQQWVTGYTDHPQKLLGPAATIGAGVAGIVTTIIVVAITSVYTSVRPEPLKEGVVRLVVPQRREQARTILHRLAESYLSWLRGLAAGMLVLWVLTYAGLLLVKLPFALVFATLTALAMVVPYYGALVSAVPPILLAVTISPGKAVIVALIYLAAHQVEGHLIEPLVMARAVNLHPATVAVGVIAAERLFGPVGLIVAVPLLVTAKVLVEELWINAIESQAQPSSLDGERPAEAGPADLSPRRPPAPRGALAV
jgi:predicted PurR-regulated permease PerM